MHWSAKLLARGVSSQEVTTRLKDSWQALGVSAALANTMAFDALFGTTEPGGAEEDEYSGSTLVVVLLTLAFGFSIFVVVQTVVLTAGINQLPEERMLREFVAARHETFHLTTVVPFQLSILALMLAIVLKTSLQGGRRARTVALFQVAFFVGLVMYVFRYYLQVMRQAERLHEEFINNNNNNNNNAVAVSKKLRPESDGENVEERRDVEKERLVPEATDTSTSAVVDDLVSNSSRVVEPVTTTPLHDYSTISNNSTTGNNNNNNKRASTRCTIS